MQIFRVGLKDHAIKIFEKKKKNHNLLAKETFRKSHKDPLSFIKELRRCYEKTQVVVTALGQHVIRP